MNPKGRIIIIDGGWACHKAIFSWAATKKAQLEGRLHTDFISPSDYFYFNIILGALKRIVVKKNDNVIIAVDARNSWRKGFSKTYKGNRHELREKATLIDWEYHYGKIDEISQQLHNATDWHFIKISNFISAEEISYTKEGKEFNVDFEDPDEMFGIEADDVQAYCAKTYPEQEVILVTGDEDLDQLTHLKNTKIFSTNLKYKSYKGCYKIIDQPLKVLADKIRKGDVSDNIIVDKKNDTDYDYKIRKLIINLLELPNFVKYTIAHVFESLKEKEMNYDCLPFPNSLGSSQRFNQIYLPDKEVTYEEAIKAHIRREKKKKKKAQENYQKQKLKKQAAKEKEMR